MEQKTKAWNTSIPSDIGKVAGILTTIRDAVNVCLGAARALANIKGVGGVNVTVSGANIVVDCSGVQNAVSQSLTKRFSASLTVAGSAPTAAEIKTALESAYSSATRAPVTNDTILLSVSSAPKFLYHVTTTGTTSGIWVVSFVINGVTYYATGTQTGVY